MESIQDAAQKAVGAVTGSLPSATGSAQLTKDEKIMHVRELIKGNGDAAWDMAWQQNTTPWDMGKSQPPLLDLMKSELGMKIQSGRSKEPRALVPGCGKGYDAAYLASLGYDTWGVDISDTALQLAKDSQPPRPNLSFKKLDFFKFEIPDRGFDLIYDYTFFCAIPVALRRGWGDRMRSLVRPEGHLITLVYPIDGPRTGGPPYSLSVDLVTEALNGGGSGAASFEKILDIIPEVSSEGHEDRERLVVWKRAPA